MHRSRMCLNVLVFNCGSSSIKYRIIHPTHRHTLYKGTIDRLTHDDHESSLEVIQREIEKSGVTFNVIGHRWVNGGDLFQKPVIVTDEIIKKLKGITSLAPLHNPHNLRGLLFARQLYPSLKQVVVFDTAFHQSIKDSVYLYPIPLELSLQHQIRKYGFHGISYQYISSVLYHHFTSISAHRTSRQVAIFHLGSGCSACVLSLDCHPSHSFDPKYAHCHDTTMGFTPLDGLMMGTRSGSIDPSIISFLSHHLPGGMQEAMSILNKQSGLLGISGLTQDVRDLLRFDHPPAHSASHSDSTSAPSYSQSSRIKLALEMFSYRAAKEMLSLTASLPAPLETIVFTGGIGENSHEIRSAILSHFKSLSKIEIDSDANHVNKFQISTDNSSVSVFVIPTNEELQIAIETDRLTR